MLVAVNSNPSVAIVGAGAVGAWLADAFAAAGWRVSVVARGDTLRVIRANGLAVEQRGTVRCSRPAAGAPSELGVQDYVMLAVKAQALSSLAPQLAPLFHATTVVVSATNGIPWWFFQDFAGPLANQELQAVDPDGAQARTFPRARTLGSVVHAAARVAAPGQIQVLAAERLILGEPGGARSPRVQALVEALAAGGIGAVGSQHIRQEVWTKLWGNMNMNPLSALTMADTGTMLADADVCELIANMMVEMQACAARLNLASVMTPGERMAITRRLGSFRTSMLVDRETGKELEYAPQLGAVVEIAERLGLHVPFCRAILGLTRLLSGARRRAEQPVPP